MKKSSKKFIAILLCLIMIFTFAACGSAENSSSDDSPLLIGVDNNLTVDVDGNNSSQTGGKDTENKNNGTTSVIGGSTEDYGGNTVTDKVDLSSNDPFANIPARLKGTTVKFATWGDESGSAYMMVIKAFEKKTGINVDIVQLSQSSYRESIATQIINKAAPDVVIADQFPASLQIVQPVQNIIDITDDFWDQELIKMTTINGNTYFLNSWSGVWQSPLAVFYNKKLFEDEGINSPADYYKNGQWSYENYLKIAREMHKLGYKTSFDPIAFNEQLGNPTLKYNTSSQKFTNNLSNTIEGYKIKLQLITEGVDDKTTNNDFISGKAAMVTTGPYGAKYNGYYKNMDDSQIAMVPLPDSYKGQKINQAVGNGARAYGICKGSKNPEGAAYFLRFFLDYKYYEIAGAEVFKNEDLKNTYFNDIVPIYKNNKNRVIEYYGQPCQFAGYSSDQYSIDSKLAGLKESDISTLIASKNNIYDASAKAANEYLATIK